jgi:hypothetical protein
MWRWNVTWDSLCIYSHRRCFGVSVMSNFKSLFLWCWAFYGSSRPLHSPTSYQLTFRVSMTSSWPSTSSSYSQNPWSVEIIMCLSNFRVFLLHNGRHEFRLQKKRLNRLFSDRFVQFQTVINSWTSINC